MYIDVQFNLHSTSTANNENAAVSEPTTTDTAVSEYTTTETAVTEYTTADTAHTVNWSMVGSGWDNLHAWKDRVNIILYINVLCSAVVPLKLVQLNKLSFCVP